MGKVNQMGKLNTTGEDTSSSPPDSTEESDPLTLLGSMLKEEFISKLLRLDERIPRKKREPITLSAAGKCQRAAMYRIIGAEKHSWGWRQRITLEDGDHAHTQLRKYLKSALHTRKHFRLMDQEKTVSLNVKGIEVRGHIDGRITRICDCSDHQDWPRDTLLEVKTCGPYTWPRFSIGKIPSDYQAQATAYMAAMGITDALFMVKDKGTGRFEFIPYRLDKVLLEQIFERLGRITRFLRGEGTSPDLAREYGPDSKGYLPFECNYCDFVLKCWKDHNPVKMTTRAVIYKVSKEVFDIPEPIEEKNR